MNNSKRYTITAALPYTNGPVHIGHLAGVYVPADIYARYLRNTGNDVLYICGSDEHGVPITLKAKKEGVLKRAGHTEAAIDFARLAGLEPAGCIVEILKEDTNFVLKVSDNGIGISSENQAYIFEPKFTTKNSGMGLGLAIIKKIIENYNQYFGVF